LPASTGARCTITTGGNEQSIGYHMIIERKAEGRGSYSLNSSWIRIMQAVIHTIGLLNDAVDICGREMQGCVGPAVVPDVSGGPAAALPRGLPQVCMTLQSSVRLFVPPPRRAGSDMEYCNSSAQRHTLNDHVGVCVIVNSGRFGATSSPVPWR
jgi:hypothetical protein